MTVVIRDRDFKPVNVSRNLRGIISSSGRNAVERVDVWPSKSGDGAQLGVTWTNGSSVITDFASFKVCKAWCAARRSFPAATIHA
jgi:hypothetical protein